MDTINLAHPSMPNKAKKKHRHRHKPKAKNSSKYVRYKFDPDWEVKHPKKKRKRRRRRNSPRPSGSNKGVPHFRFRRDGRPLRAPYRLGVTKRKRDGTILQTYMSPNFGDNYAWERVCWDFVNPGPPYRCGEGLNLFVYTQPRDVPIWSGKLRNRDNTLEYSGVMLPGGTPSSVSFDSKLVCNGLKPAGSEIGDVKQWGSTGWNLYRPGKPTADLGQFLYEIRDVTRMLQSTAEGFHGLWKSMGGDFGSFGPKSLADHWLNTQFGWRPFLNDLRKLQKTTENLSRTFAYIRSRNGKWTSRKGPVRNAFIETHQVVNNVNQTAFTPVLDSSFYKAGMTSGSQTWTKYVSKHVWFEGCFRYWIPDTGSYLWEGKALASLYGAMPSPSLLWSITPWSWLYDWTGNISTNLENMSNGWADNLVSKYAYIMGTTDIDYVLETTANFEQATISSGITFSQHFKKREAASPFGFMYSGYKDLSTRQWSILSALGISYL